MAELLTHDGTWTFDDEVIRIVPGRDRGVHKLRQSLGEVTVPLHAVAGIAYEPGRKGGRLRLRLREGADPLLHATGGGLPDSADPYQVAVDADRTGVAEYFADEVRHALLLNQVPAGPTGSYLLPGPKVPLSAGGGDGTLTFDGERVTISWNWTAEEGKKSAGPRELALGDLAGVEWRPNVGLENGHLRFRVKGAPASAQPPKHDPNSVVLWGLKKEIGHTALLAAAVAARLPHPSESAQGAQVDQRPALLATSSEPRAAIPAQVTDHAEDPDALLRRLRELGELKRDGILTDEEFTAAKSALLRRFG
ncbi:DUF4429 domain-containing protein [Streptomyces sp. H39-S7]|uniref:DUF4429 domain-containing protein n=1 Tax=Streptomyces sp. H39-S7 TaxID=3004357 RepID=UPI0022B02856|nr:DUF4429 domain-containing protein [Streptomyces sp. H39-S7]MCZ4123139.1 DUF4429 domain-containing protein [Streptomyces sp. H39-S7]